MPHFKSFEQFCDQSHALAYRGRQLLAESNHQEATWSCCWLLFARCLRKNFASVVRALGGLLLRHKKTPS